MANLLKRKRRSVFDGELKRGRIYHLTINSLAKAGNSSTSADTTSKSSIVLQLFKIYSSPLLFANENVRRRTGKTKKMAEILPDGSMQGYSGYCPRCRATVRMNMQGDMLDHDCSVRPVDTLDWDDQDIIDVFGEDDFEPCCNCDMPDACADFGCAIKSGVRKVPEW